MRRICNDVLDCYLLNDQPATCGICGGRTDIEEINYGIQIHECLNPGCSYKFTTEEENFLVSSEE
jgi:hypothetical protein